MRRVVDEIMRDGDAAARRIHARLVRARPAREMVQMAILDAVSGGRERPAVAPGNIHRRIARVADFARQHGMAQPARDDHATVAHVAHRAGADHDIRAVFNHDAAPAPALEQQATELHMRHTLRTDQRRGQDRHQRLSKGRPIRRPVIELPCGAVDIVFARLVQLLQHVEEIEALARPDAILRIRRGGHHFSVGRVEAGDTVVGVGPVPAPVAVHPEVIHRLPALRAGRMEHEARGGIAEGFIPVVTPDRHDPLHHRVASGVRPLRQGHGPAGIEKLRVCGRDRTHKPARRQSGRISHAGRLEVSHPHIQLSFFGKPGKDCRIGHRRKRPDDAAAEQARTARFCRAVNHGGFRRAAILRAQLKGIRHQVIA